MGISGKKFTWKNVSNFLLDKELKAILGGSAVSGTCCWRSGNGTVCDCGATKADAIHMANCKDRENGTECTGNWCCDSCSSTEWAITCG